MAGETLDRTTVVVDCRWLGLGGAGKATELLLEGLRELEPPGVWLLWGAPATRAFLWSGTEWREARHPPTALSGQREAYAVPRGDVGIYLHQIRPLRRGPSVTLIHDTIPLRYKSRAARRLKRAVFRVSARVSTRIVTVSEYSRGCIERDLHVPGSKIRVVRYPVDEAMVVRVIERRRRLPRREVGLYVGRFAPHKNLHALIDAFARTRFRRRGGTLLLAGGAPHEISELQSLLARRGVDGVSLEGALPQATLEEWYATARFLVMPSLEEGFGLPAWEAMACGLPLCVSDGGALPEITRGVVTPFAARSIEAMAAAIDLAAEQTPGPPAAVDAPSLPGFAAVFVEEAARAVSKRA